jgi:hypothetical protein
MARPVEGALDDEHLEAHSQLLPLARHSTVCAVVHRTQPKPPVQVEIIKDALAEASVLWRRRCCDPLSAEGETRLQRRNAVIRPRTSACPLAKAFGVDGLIEKWIWPTV